MILGDSTTAVANLSNALKHSERQAKRKLLDNLDQKSNNSDENIDCDKNNQQHGNIK